MQERNIALKLMYVGTAYHGWQVQKNAVSVAETLEKALSTVVCHPVKCTGAGRTDAGVHAEVYIANFHTRSSIPTDRIPLAVNTRLPDDIVVVKATEVPEHFNAIGSCLRKEYTYRIYNSRLGNAFYVNRAWFYPKHLDESIMQRAADCFVGTHDFSAVRAVGTEVRSPVRTVHYFNITRTGDLIECRVPLQYGAGYGGYLRLRRRGQVCPRGRERHPGKQESDRRRPHRPTRRTLYDPTVVRRRRTVIPPHRSA